MRGKIIKGISGFYYVHVAESGIYECKAKGIFRNRNIKPLVGDNVEIDVLDERDKEGNITDIAERKNELIRPAVANIDQALLVFATAKPEPNYNLLERFLIMMRCQQIPVTICFNKSDLSEDKKMEQIAAVYKECGYPLVFTSAEKNQGMEELLSLLEGKTSAVAGPSGVGKSSIINRLQDEVQMETGDISKKIGWGKNTTRHSQLICIKENTYIMDTPGFGSLELFGIRSDILWKYYEEFLPCEPDCRFKGCSHVNEPECGIKQAVEEGKIHRQRYDNYVSLYQELKEKEKFDRRKE